MAEGVAAAWCKLNEVKASGFSCGGRQLPALVQGPVCSHNGPPHPLVGTSTSFLTVMSSLSLCFRLGGSHSDPSHVAPCRRGSVKAFKDMAFLVPTLAPSLLH